MRITTLFRKLIWKRRCVVLEVEGESNEFNEIDLKSGKDSNSPVFGVEYTPLTQHPQKGKCPQDGDIVFVTQLPRKVNVPKMVILFLLL